MDFDKNDLIDIIKYTIIATLIILFVATIIYKVFVGFANYII